MNPKIIELQFSRGEDGVVTFTPENMETLCKYVIPIIEKNRGWATESLTLEDFKSDPEKWRDDINATVEADPKAKVFVALDSSNKDQPIGLLEYIEENFQDLSNKKFSEVLWEMLGNSDSKYWQKLLEYSFFDRKVFDANFKKLREFISARKLYKYVGVVVIPELQGQKSGVSDLFYLSMKDGFLLGSTSTPLVLAKRRKLFKTTVFTPPLGEKFTTLDEIACLTIIAASLFADYGLDIPEESFGIETHVGFALRDKAEYMTLAKSFLDQGKITELDYKRLDKILDLKKGQGMIVSS